MSIPSFTPLATLGKSEDSPGRECEECTSPGALGWGTSLGQTPIIMMTSTAYVKAVLS